MRRMGEPSESKLKRGGQIRGRIHRIENLGEIFGESFFF